MTRPIRIALRAGRRMIIGLLWAASLIVAAGIGWSVGRFGPGEAVWSAWGGALEASRGSAEIDAGFPLQTSPLGGPGPAGGTGLESVEPPVTLPVLPPPEEPAPTPPPAVKPKPKPKPNPKPKARPDPTPEVKELSEPPPVEIELPAEPQASVLERTREVEQLATAGSVEQAGEVAAALLTEHITYSELAAALVTDGAAEIEARLTALRMLDLAGHASISRDVARELRRGYAGSSEVADTIRDWGILKPQIVTVESSVEDGRYLLVQGTVENPDIVRVRKLQVRVEALDGAGSVLESEVARVRPKLLEPGQGGAFVAEFKGLDPALILRTRATVIAWESGIVGGS